MIIRQAGAEGIPHALALLDKATEWLVSQGRPGQWGTEPQSTDPRRIAQSQQWVASGGFYLAWVGEQAVGALVVGALVVGALVVGDAPAHIPAATEPELYVNLLVTDRAHAGKGIGSALLDHARDLARAKGVGLLRLDCYAGDDRALVRYYERQGFTATDPFSVEHPRGLWLGQVLEQRV